jgi:alpha/beta superfamily hydrolase
VAPRDRVSRWSDLGAWAGDGLRREVFFFRSGDVDLYGSLYASATLTRPLGVVVCGSWGVEADRSDPLVHGLALAAARLGGAGLVFHYAGFGDSHGDLATATLEGLAANATDAVREAARRSAATEWHLAGFTFGASIACLAQPAAKASGLILMQPALKPSAYLQRLAKRADRATFGTGGAGMAFGYPVPERIVDRGEEADAAVARALSGFRGDGVAIAYETPAPSTSALPSSVEPVTVPGSWRFGSRDQPHMLATAAKWLKLRPAALANGTS